MIEAIGMLTMLGGTVVFGLVPTRPLADCDPESARAQLIRRAELRGTYAVGVIGATFGFGLLGYAEGRPISALLVGAIGLATFVVMHPWWLVKTIAIPLGLWRTAAACSRIGGPPWLRDPIGGSVLAGVLACTRKRKPATHALLELEQRLGRAPLRGAGIVAAALIAHERGDIDSARTLMQSVDDLEPDILPPHARRVALDWRIADAAARGDWPEIVRIGHDALSLSRTARLFVLVARRMTGAAIPRRSLFRAWLTCARRRHTWSFVRAAMRARALPQELVEIEADACAANGAGLLATTAVSLHFDAARATERGELEAAALRRLGNAWDETLYDFEARRRLRARALSLGCRTTVEAHVVALHRNVCRELAELLPACAIDPPPRRGSLGRAALENRRVQQGAIGRSLLQLATAQEAPIGPRSWRLWQTWIELRTAYERAARAATVADMREVFAVVERSLAPFVGWLWITRHERALANAVSVWLVCEAERVRHRDAAAHHRSWAVAGP
jgi:hypothetical protein